MRACLLAFFFFLFCLQAPEVSLLLLRRCFLAVCVLAGFLLYPQELLVLQQGSLSLLKADPQSLFSVVSLCGAYRRQGWKTGGGEREGGLFSFSFRRLLGVKWGLREEEEEDGEGGRTEHNRRERGEGRRGKVLFSGCQTPFLSFSLLSCRRSSKD